jgi:anti-sigma regulatory factor (Ser/Thr protein kinase)
MILVAQAVVAVVEPTQAGEARRIAVRMAEAAGFDEPSRGEVAIVATELAANLARYAKSGRLLVQAFDDGDGQTVEMLSIDHGPGIGDVPACLHDGYSTGGTPGNGLGAVRRLSTTFDIHSTPGVGTVALSRVRRPADARSNTAFEWGAISIPAPHETVCGDAWRIVERGGECAVLVADGLGHGPMAAEAAIRAVAAFEADPFADGVETVARIHRALGGSRGAAAAVARIGRAVRYAGVGNISGTLVGDGRARGLASQNGTAGVQIRRVTGFDYDWPAHGRLVMHSDGVSNRWTMDAYSGLAPRHPAVLAGVLWRDYGRGRDDATIVVVAPKAPRGHG